MKNLNDRARDLISHPKQDYHWRVPFVCALFLLPSAYSNMAVFHTFVELFAIGIAVMSFIVAWNTFTFLRDRFLLFLGCAYFWVGVIDLFHTLSFKGVVTFESLEPGATMQFWIAARYLEATCLLCAPYLVNRHLPPTRVFVSLGAVSTLVIVCVFEGKFPVMFVPGEGLTSAKVYSEYIIIAILLFSAIGYVSERRHISESTRNLLLLSIALTMMAEVSFTLYSGLGDAPLIVGHIFKLLSFWAIYCALIESALKRPFHSLFQVVHSYDTVTDATVIIDENGAIQHANKDVLNKLGDQVLGQNCHDVLHEKNVRQVDCLICEAIKNKQVLHTFEFENIEKQTWHEASLSPIHTTDAYSAMVHSIRDITDRKRTEEKFNSLNRLYNVLSRTNQAIAQTHDADELFQNICSIAIEHGSFKMSWIGFIEGKEVQPKFIAGDDSGYLHEMKMRVDDSEWAQGPVGSAAKTLDVACVNSVSSDLSFAPWREAAIQRGYCALAAVPLMTGEKLLGIFTLYSDQENVFDNAMLSLLRSLSKDISASIYNLEQSKLKQEADETIRQLSSAVEQSVNAVIITNTRSEIEYVNPGFTNLSGYSREEAIGKNVFKLVQIRSNDQAYQGILEGVYAGKSWQGEVQTIKKNGEAHWTMQTVSPIKNESGEVTHFVSTVADNTRLHEAQETIQQLAFFDPLTGLANRRLLMDRIEHGLASARRHGSMLAVILCDLDNFKNINDSLGHEYGDQLLKHVAGVLKRNIREEDTVSRLGGDEFVLIVSEGKNSKRVTDITARILKELGMPILLSGHQVAVSSSVGIAVYPQDGTTPNELLRNSDLAMYHAKDAGKNCFHFYQQEMNQKVQGRLALENKLRNAIEQDMFELYYQPQVNLMNGGIVGFEALIRWNDPDDGFISPDIFIPLAEESGLIGKIGDWVIRRAYRDWQAITELGKNYTRMSVNVAAYQFRHSNYLFDVINEMHDLYPNCPANMFTLELTEGTLIENVEETATTLATLKRLGVSISIDDFGTGYSSLNYLKRFPIDQLKIDRSFVQDLLIDPNDEAITTAIIVIAQKLGMKLVAEGIEERAQSEFLLSQGCDFAQGYYYYKPMPLSDIKKLI